MENEMSRFSPLLHFAPGYPIQKYLLALQLSVRNTPKSELLNRKFRTESLE